MRLLIYVLVFIQMPLKAQVCLLPLGADCWGLGGQSAAVPSVFSVQNNPAALAFFHGVGAGMYSETRYMQPGLLLSALALAMPLKQMHTGLGIVQQGNDRFSQQKLNLSIGRLLGRQVSLGINIDLLGTHIAEQAYKVNFVTELGLFVKPTARLDVGCYLFNPLRARYGFQRPEDIPSLLRTGFCYRFSGQLSFYGEYEYSSLKAITRLGLAYAPTGKYTFYAGWAQNPLYLSFGSAFNWKKLRLTFAASRHQVLGITPHFMCTYTPNK